MGVVVDVSLCLIFLISLVIGSAKGFLKQLSGFLRGIAAFVLSILLTAAIITALQPTGFYLSFVKIAAGWFKSDTMIIIVNSPEELAELLSQHGSLKILSGLSEVLYNDMQSMFYEGFPCNTLGILLGHHVANLICCFVLWLILLLALKAIFKGIISLMKNIIVMPAFKTLDKIFGALWSFAFTYAILVGIIFALTEAVILKFVPALWEKLAEFIRNTTVLLWVHDTNVIGELIAGLLNVSIPSLQLPSAA